MARYELDQRQRLLVDQHGSAAELSPATVTLPATGIVCRYNGYRPVELLRVRRRIPH